MWGGGRVVQRHVLYLGEINTSQELAWRKSIEVFADGPVRPSTVALFAEDRGEAVIGMSRLCACGFGDAAVRGAAMGGMLAGALVVGGVAAG